MSTDSIAVCLMLPLAAAGGIALANNRPNLREAVSLVASAALVLALLGLEPAVLAGNRPTLDLIEVMPGLVIAFEVEPLGLLFALVAAFLWFASAVYSIGYMRGNGEAHQTRFYLCFALALAATVAIAFSANAFTLLLFYEALTFVTYPLVTHHGDAEARNGGRTYLAFLLGTSVLFLLPAVIFTWHAAGTTDFRAGGILPEGMAPAAAAVLLAMYVFGIGKAALMPFHRWLPAAMVAPTPVSALLHAVAVVKAGVFSIVKIVVYLFGLDLLGGVSTHWLTATAGFTVIAASVVALGADNLKRRLAYSTVSQLAYVVLASALLTPLSIVGAALHIVSHAFGKITLFFAAGSIYTATGKTNVSQLDGIGLRMPWTMGAFAIGALSMIGLPPAAGFVSKWYMLSGAMSQAHWAAVMVIVASTLLNAAYLLPIVYRAFFRGVDADSKPHGEAPLPIVLALVITAAATLMIFFMPGVPLALAHALAFGACE